MHDALTPLPPHPKFACANFDLSPRGRGSVAAAFAFVALAATPSLAQQPPENPIPPSGGALKFANPDDEDALPHAFDAGWNGEQVCEALFENEHLRAARCAFPPGVGHERHWHRAHWGYIVEGGVMQVADADGTREQETPAGATWWSDGVEWHEAVNIGDTTTVYVIIEPKGAGE